MRIGEEKTGLTMHSDDRPKQKRRQSKSCKPGPDAKNKSDSANHLPTDRDIGEPAGKTKRYEKRSRPLWREDKNLQSRMSKKQNSKRKAKK